MTPRQRRIIFADAKRHSLGLLHYLQTDSHEPVPPGRPSFAHFHLTREFSTADRLPPKPYVRESLRLDAMYVMRQQDTMGYDGKSAHYAQTMYYDTVASWQFEYDYHPTQRRFLEDDSSGPWHAVFRPLRNWGPPYSGLATFPLRSLIPKRVDGLLGGAKNLGYTSIVSSAVRLHDHCTLIGQAAGATAAVALRHDVEARQIPFDPRLLNEVREGLCSRADGAVPAAVWPFADLATEHQAYVAAQRLAARQALPVDATSPRLEPDRHATAGWRDTVVQRTLAGLATQNDMPQTPEPQPPEGELTRGEFLTKWWDRVKHLPLAPWARRDPLDADGDGIADADDAAPFDANDDNRMDHLDL